YDSKMFINNAIDKIKHFRSHASLAYYCGRNEGIPPSNLLNPLIEATKVYDGTRFFVADSAGPSGSV
ncbi:hypothetical protein EZS27_042283, partial [termite gut metagenome]